MLRWISAATLAQRHSKSSWLSFGLGRYKASPAKVLIPSVHDTVTIRVYWKNRQTASKLAR